ncbi:MAG: transglycosylase SLT domain-containing protein [Pseudomonadota bacterium]
MRQSDQEYCRDMAAILRGISATLLFLCVFTTSAAGQTELDTGIKPPIREAQIPHTSWAHLGGTDMWTRSAISALKSHGAPLVSTVPADIADWCPAYPAASEAGRRAFWVGFLSRLAKHESTYRPQVVGGGGRWYGLLQILPATARGYGCRARSGAALKHGPSNLSCGVRIMAVTVLRDGVVSRRGRGVAADWGPLVSSRKRRDMQAWTRKQSYCTPLSAVRPRVRPEGGPKHALKLRPRPRPDRVAVSD